MKKEEFVQKVISEFRDYLPPTLKSEITVEKSSVIKMNDKKHIGICIRRTGVPIAPNIYLDDMYTAFTMGADFEQLMYKLVATYLESLQHSPCPSDFEGNDIRDSARCGLRLLSASRNRRYLSEHVNKDFGLGLVLTADFCIPDNNGGEWRTTISWDLMDEIGIGVEEFFSDIIFSNSINYPAMLCEFNLEPTNEINRLHDEHIDTGMLYVLKTTRHCHGAVAIAYPGVLERIADAFDSSFYVVPSSVHEVIIVPEDFDVKPEALTAMLVDANETVVAPDDVLSNNLMYYDRGKAELSIWREKPTMFS